MVNTLALLTLAILTMAILTMAILTMAILTMVLLTMAAGGQHAVPGLGRRPHQARHARHRRRARKPRPATAPCIRTLQPIAPCNRRRTQPACLPLSLLPCVQVPAEGGEGDGEGGDEGEGGSTTIHRADTGRLLLQVHDELIFELILTMSILTMGILTIAYLLGARRAHLRGHGGARATAARAHTARHAGT